MGLLDIPLRSAAKAVLAKLGTTVTLTQITPGTYNTTTGGGTAVGASVEVQGTYGEYTSSQLGDHIMLGDRKFILPASQLEWNPTTADRLTDGSITYRIVNVESPQATDQAVVHILQLRGGP